MVQPSQQRSNEVLLTEVQVRCMDRRRDGLSFRAIAAEVGLSATMVRNHVLNALEMIKEEPREAVRALELERLDYAIMRLRPKVDAGDVAAITAFIKAGESRRRMLGIDEAIKVDATVTHVTQEDLELRDLISASRAQEALDGGPNDLAQVTAGADDGRATAGPSDPGLSTDPS